MKKISRSPERFSFERESHIKSQEEKGEPPITKYLEIIDKLYNSHQHKFDNDEAQKNNLEYDLLTTEWILEKVRKNENYAQNLYAAMCNNSFQKLEVLPILKEERWDCSWRYAGGIIADMIGEGDYIDWYCSGIGSSDSNQYVSESVVTDEIREDLKQLGWIVIADDA